MALRERQRARESEERDTAFPSIRDLNLIPTINGSDINKLFMHISISIHAHANVFSNTDTYTHIHA